MSQQQLLAWIVMNLLTDAQLDVIPPGETEALRFLKLPYLME